MMFYSSALIFSISLISLVIFKVNAQVTQSSYSEHPDDDLHQNQIPPPEYQPSEDDVKNALTELVTNQIDSNKDGRLSTEELRDWLEIVHKKIIDDSIDRQWKYYEPTVSEVHSWEGYAPEMKEVLQWDVFKRLTYPDEYLKEDPSNAHAESMKRLLARSERRWNSADANSDSLLTKEEFKDFVHPEESKNIRNILVDEALEDMDSNNDTSVTVEEYMKHLYSVSDETERDDPAWKSTHEGHFKEYLDKNHDGKLDREELTDWLIPSYNKHEAEAYRLITTADEDKDGELSVEEIGTHFHDFYAILPPDFWHQFAPKDESKHDEL